jgi:hypothetical protein
VLHVQHNQQDRDGFYIRRPAEVIVVANRDLHTNHNSAGVSREHVSHPQTASVSRSAARDGFATTASTVDLTTPPRLPSSAQYITIVALFWARNTDRSLAIRAISTAFAV